MKRIIAAAFVVASLFAPLALADSNHGKKEHGGHGASAQAGAMSEGEVRKVDKEAKKLTIRHGPLANLDMPAMTMVFQVKDPAMLEQVKAGDKIRFQADKVGSAYTVTHIESAK